MAAVIRAVINARVMHTSQGTYCLLCVAFPMASLQPPVVCSSAQLHRCTVHTRTPAHAAECDLCSALRGTCDGSGYIELSPCCLSWSLMSLFREDGECHNHRSNCHVTNLNLSLVTLTPPNIFGTDARLNLDIANPWTWVNQGTPHFLRPAHACHIACDLAHPGPDLQHAMPFPARMLQPHAQSQ